MGRKTKESSVLKQDKELVEKRLNNIKDLYFKLDELMEHLPDVVSKDLKAKLKKIISEGISTQKTG